MKMSNSQRPQIELITLALPLTKLKNPFNSTLRNVQENHTYSASDIYAGGYVIKSISGMTIPVNVYYQIEIIHLYIVKYSNILTYLAQHTYVERF